jgi:hypothetical protein
MISIRRDGKEITYLFDINTNKCTMINDHDDTEKLINKYYSIIFKMIMEYSILPGIMKSIQNIRKLLSDDYISMFRWFEKHIDTNFSNMSQIEQSKIVIDAILDSTSHNNILPYYRQFSRYIPPLLKVANNEEKLKSTMKQLFAPITYDDIDETVKVLGKCSIQHMTINDTSKLANAISIPNVGLIKSDTHITTISELLSIDPTYLVGLKIYVTDESSWVGMYNHSFTYRRAEFPWFCSYKNKPFSHIGGYKWLQVKTIVPGDNMLFVVKRCNIPNPKRYVNNPLNMSFLNKGDVSLIVKKVFYRMITTYQAEVNHDEPPAIAVGRPMKPKGDKISLPIYLLLNKKIITLTHY